MRKQLTFKESPADIFSLKVKSGQIGKMIDEKMREAEEIKEKRRQEKMQAAEIEKTTFENSMGKDWMKPA